MPKRYLFFGDPWHFWVFLVVVSLKALQQIPSDKNHSCSPSDFRLEVHVSQEIRETVFLDMIGLGRWDDGTFNFLVEDMGVFTAF